jgi:hypothetical protein
MRRLIYPRRRGATLVEVLVAIFLMGIGMLALLTLFPIGVLRMEQSLRDDRHTLASINATATANIQNVRSDPKLQANATKTLFEIGPNGWANPSQHGPSFPVFMDPIGYQNALPGASQDFVASDTTLKSSVYRIPTSFTPSKTSILQWFAINDEILFETDDVPSATPPTAAALPKLNSASQLDRNTRVSWAYMLQRPASGDASLVNLSVVVYSDRPTSFSRQYTPAENLYQARFFPSTSKVELTYGATSVVPTLRSGDWILDCSVEQATDPVTGPYSIPHATFYRVVSATELSATQTVVEVQTPIRGFNRSLPEPYSGQVAVLEGVAEVFEKGVGRLP